MWNTDFLLGSQLWRNLAMSDFRIDYQVIKKTEFCQISDPNIERIRLISNVVVELRKNKKCNSEKVYNYILESSLPQFCIL